MDDRDAGRPPTILLLSGPNLSLLGEREPEVYGTATLADHVAAARLEAEAVGLAVDPPAVRPRGRPSWRPIHAGPGLPRRASSSTAGPSPTTAGRLHDALAAFEGPVVELHISNPGAREEFRHRRWSPRSTAVIPGWAAAGYPLAVRAMAILLGIVEQMTVTETTPDASVRLDTPVTENFPPDGGAACDDVAALLESMRDVLDGRRRRARRQRPDQHPLPDGLHRIRGDAPGRSRSVRCS